MPNQAKLILNNHNKDNQTSCCTEEISNGGHFNKTEIPNQSIKSINEAALFSNNTITLATANTTAISNQSNSQNLSGNDEAQQGNPKRNAYQQK